MTELVSDFICYGNNSQNCLLVWLELFHAELVRRFYIMTELVVNFYWYGQNQLNILFAVAESGKRFWY